MTRSDREARAAWRRRQVERVAAGRAVYGQRVDELVAEDLADEDLCRHLAAWVDRVRRQTGAGPTWRDLAEQARPDLLDDLAAEGAPDDTPVKVYTEALCLGLIRDRWIKTGRERGSMRAGPRLRQAAARA